MNWSALLTTCVSTVEVLGKVSLSPGYDAVIECDPTEREVVLKEAWPLPLSGALEITVAPSLNVTEPLGVFGPALVTVEVNVTDCPN